MTGIKSQAGHFRDGGHRYAKFRPNYPLELISYLAGMLRYNRTAVDVGCGTGQLSIRLANKFQNVIACDISADQICNALKHDRIEYAVAPAHALPCENNSADMITVAQAAHWFNLAAFYKEVERIAAPNAILALISYGVMSIEGPLRERFEEFYWHDIHAYWPPERRHVETEYSELPFPFELLKTPDLVIDSHLDIEGLLGYIETWSAVKAARQDGSSYLVDNFRRDAAKLWGLAESHYRAVWPLNIKLGQL